MGYFHLPDQQSLRETTSYHQIFALTFLWNVGLAGIMFVVFFIIFLMLKVYQLKNRKLAALLIRDSLLSEQSRQQSGRFGSEKQEGKGSSNTLSRGTVLDVNGQFTGGLGIQNPKTKRFKVFNFLTSFFFYCIWVDIALIHLVFYIFGFMGRGLSHDILSVIVMLMVVLIPTLIWKNQTKRAKARMIKKQIIFTVVCLAVWLGICVFTIVTMKGVCICYYNENYGFSVGTEAGPYLSTEWMRTNNIDQVCKDDELCHLYATVPQQPATEVFINMHTGLNVQRLMVRLTSDDNVFEKNISEHYNMTNVEQIGVRLVHTAFFEGLQPDTLYKLEVFQQTQDEPTIDLSRLSNTIDPNYATLKNVTNKLLRSTNYKTTPHKSTSKLKLAVGGDISMTIQGKQLTEQLIQYDPDIIIIGGDNSYDDGMRTCYYSWDNFYDIFDDLNQKLDRLVPLIMTVGNHDVGFDALAPVKLDMGVDAIPLYFLFNPQHLLHNGSDRSIPALKNRSTIHTHIIGPTVHLHLDSGYILKYENQTEYIRKVAQKYKGEFYLFANYHNPIYPSCTNSNPGSNDMKVIENSLKHWTPLFDEYNFVAGFEHHTHHKKFTYKLRNSTVVEDTAEGVRYVGDGSWGVVQGSCTPDRVNSHKEWFKYQDVEKPNHLWLITLSKQQDLSYKINYTAIDQLGKSNITQIDTLKALSTNGRNQVIQ